MKMQTPCLVIFFVLLCGVVSCQQQQNQLTLSYSDLTSLTSCTTNLATLGINFQLNSMTVTFQLANASFQCLLFDKMTVTSSGPTPSTVTLEFPSQTYRNSYLMNLNNIQGSNLQTGEQSLILSPILIQTCLCTGYCGACSGCACSSYCSGTPYSTQSTSTTVIQTLADGKLLTAISLS